MRTTLGTCSPSRAQVLALRTYKYLIGDVFSAFDTIFTDRLLTMKLWVLHINWGLNGRYSIGLRSIARRATAYTILHIELKQGPCLTPVQLMFRSGLLLWYALLAHQLPITLEWVFTYIYSQNIHTRCSGTNTTMSKATTCYGRVYAMPVYQHTVYNLG